MTKIIGENAVTIDEAIERLGSQAPVRPTFIQAVKRGKIRKVTDKSCPKGETLVSWASVEEYVANGGFKPRKQPASGIVAVAQSTLPPVPKEKAAVDVGSPKASIPSPMPIAPQISNTQHGTGHHPAGHRPSGKSSKSAESAKSAESGRLGPKRFPAQPRDCAAKQPKPKRKVAAVKGRRNLPLRKLKDSLRHLDFEQMKSIRDWADNRLITVLRPAAPVPAGVVEAKTKSV